MAKIFGPYCLIMVSGVFLNRNFYQKVMDDFLKNTALMYIGGIIALLFGLLVVGVHNIWVMNWPVIITIMGWLAIAKGALIIVFPNSMAKFIEYHKIKPSILLVRLFIVLIMGVALTYFGYFNVVN